jgi:RimJ/RimL family protein N-acetyltransferase
MKIQRAAPAQLPQILKIYEAARAYMREQGNPEQWKDGYPGEALITSDIERGNLYLCCEGEELLGVFYYAEEDDPTYRFIEGNWLNADPYGVVHRIAVASHKKGVASFCFAYAFSRCRNLKIDTHKDNLPMQRALEKNGFVPCGVIYLENGEARLAFQKTE